MIKRTLASLAGLLLAAGCPPPPGQNTPPLADAGEAIVSPWGATVVLHGTCTDPDPGDQAQLTYQWRLESSPPASQLTPANPEAIGGRTGPDPFFDPDAAGEYVLSLVCTDPKGAAGNLDVVSVTVEAPPPNRPPTVDAGEDATVEVAEPTTIEAQAADPDGDALTFAWRIAEKPEGSLRGDGDLRGAGSAQVGLTPDVAGRFVLEVTARDPAGETASDSVAVTAVEATRLDGSLTVTVVDRRTLLPLEGAAVALGTQVLGTVTDAAGRLTHTAAGLQGPLDVTVAAPGSVAWDHDGDPATAPVTAPRYRTTTMTGVDRAEVTLAVAPTDAGREAAATGRVKGSVPAAVFERLPRVERMFSIAGAQMSGQVRMVIVAPIVPRASLVDLSPADFFAPALAPAVPLPGNMATDDAFLNENAATFGRDEGPGGEGAFTLFALPVPAGRQRLVILGGLATLDIARLIPLLLVGAAEGHYASEMGISMGTVDFTTAFVGFVDVDVPAGGEVDLGAALAAPASWPVLRDVAYVTAKARETVCDANGECVELDRVHLFPSDAIHVSAGALPADPRLEEALPATAPFELLCDAGDGAPARCATPRLVDLPLPPTVATGVPYGVNLLALDLPKGHALAPAGGHAVVGYRFARAPGQDEGTTRFAVPPLEGPFAGLSYAATGFAVRRVGSRPVSGRFFSREGRSQESQTRLSPGVRVELSGGGPFPALPRLAEEGGGLAVEVLFEVDDATQDPPAVLEAQAVSADPAAPPGGAGLPGHLTLRNPSGAALQILTVAAVDRSGEVGAEAPIVQPAWDILYPGGETQLVLPAFPAAFAAPAPSGAEVWVRLSGYRFLGAFSYQQPDPLLLSQRRRAVVEDAWSFRMP